MANITNAQAVRFVNEVIRPLAEAFKALDANAQIAKNDYIGTFLPLVFGHLDTDLIDDGREAEGVSRLTLGDVKACAAEINTYVTQMEQAGVRDIISKPAVRRIIASIT